MIHKKLCCCSRPDGATGVGLPTDLFTRPDNIIRTGISNDIGLKEDARKLFDESIVNIVNGENILPFICNTFYHLCKEATELEVGKLHPFMRMPKPHNNSSQ